MRSLAAIIAVLILTSCATPTSAPVEHRRDAGAPGVSVDHRRAQAGNGVPTAAPSRSAEISSVDLTPTQGDFQAYKPQEHRASTPPEITIVKGDTLFSISERYGTPLEALIAINGLTPPYALRIGQTLVLPKPETHSVKSGETISQIAAQYDIDPPSLLLLNRIRDPRSLRPGQILILPSDERLGSQPATQTATRSTQSRGGSGVSASRPAETSSGSSSASSGRGVTISTAQFEWPLRGEILSDFGAKPGGLKNDGVNIAAKEGDPVKAAGSGSVVYAGNELAGYGELVLVEHAGGWITAYAHNRVLKVAEGQSVTRGQIIAEAGSTGSVETPQVHFEVRRGVSPVDPLGHLPPA